MVRLSSVNRDTDPVYISRKIRKFRTDKFYSETNGNFDSCNSCKRLGTSHLHELHESKFPFVSLSNLSVRNFRIFLLMYTGSLSPGSVIGHRLPLEPRWSRRTPRRRPRAMATGTQRPEHYSPVLNAPVGAVPALFATVRRASPGSFRTVKIASSGAWWRF